ncbi:MAG: MSMEG_4193 family putative phosphomutase [Anaerolineae bacterium]|nr:MSMEG_4193 family putative phosphomutase [Anaerolineae bacterium]
MTLILLIRHAENDYVQSGRLAGWTPDVHLNDQGKQQAEALGQRLAAAKLQGVYSSPLERAVETAQSIVYHHPDLELQIEEDVGEVRYGKWTGQQLKKLARTRLWQVVQHYPSRARFPDGESIREMQVRAVGAVEQIVEYHPDSTVVVVSHADVIKAVVAYYAGMAIDMFQRIVIAPASISAIAVNKTGVSIVRLNDISHYELSGPKIEGK